MQKQSPIRSKKLRNAARGMPCTINFVGICNDDRETTVLAHLHDEQFGMGQKADDTSAVHACFNCHTALDTTTHGLGAAELYKTLLRALQRTIRSLVGKGVMVVPMDAPPKPKAAKTRRPKEQRAKISSGGFQKKFRKKMNGDVVVRGATQ